MLRMSLSMFNWRRYLEDSLTSSYQWHNEPTKSCFPTLVLQASMITFLVSVAELRKGAQNRHRLPYNHPHSTKRKALSAFQWFALG